MYACTAGHVRGVCVTQRYGAPGTVKGSFTATYAISCSGWFKHFALAARSPASGRGVMVIWSRFYALKPVGGVPAGALVCEQTSVPIFPRSVYDNGALSANFA